ncbi:hypothetical protein [Billgrantia endophytica]|uniref:Uncharacterized protein n=1 Tax=Billgrantia endophytica TaxID=2033802 RepID=A0A2N7TUE3_9GAMM|nr:hypothetical protein [Halomonas endophytica]PMR71805.1 hypothetical protein C1H69_23000 [Halomonas endophytica]
MKKIMDNKISEHILSIWALAIFFNVFIYIAHMTGSPIANPFVSMLQEIGYKAMILQFFNSLIAVTALYSIFMFIAYMMIKFKRRGK